MPPNVDSILHFGKCPRCGRAGTDDDGNTLTGYELDEYQGSYMCQLCINELQDSAHDKLSNERHVEEQQFRDAIGMKRTVE